MLKIFRKEKMGGIGSIFMCVLTYSDECPTYYVTLFLQATTTIHWPFSQMFWTNIVPFNVIYITTPSKMISFWLKIWTWDIYCCHINSNYWQQMDLIEPFNLPTRYKFKSASCFSYKHFCPIRIIIVVRSLHGRNHARHLSPFLCFSGYKYAYVITCMACKKSLLFPTSFLC